MPYSSEEGKAYALKQIRGLSPSTILDVGAGSGTYGRMIRDSVPGVKALDAVEIWEPYVEQFNLHDIYDLIFLRDIREFAGKMPEYDLIIMGDVLEHLSNKDAIDVMAKLRAKSKHVLLSLPIIVWEQGAVDGNRHEAHLYHWTHDEVENEFKPMRSESGEQIGVYLLKGDIE